MPLFTVAAIKRPIVSVTSTQVIEEEKVLVAPTDVTAPDNDAALALLGRLIDPKIHDLTGIDLKVKPF